MDVVGDSHVKPHVPPAKKRLRSTGTSSDKPKPKAKGKRSRGSASDPSQTTLQLSAGPHGQLSVEPPTTRSRSHPSCSDRSSARVTPALAAPHPNRDREIEFDNDVHVPADEGSPAPRPPQLLSRGDISLVITHAHLLLPCAPHHLPSYRRHRYH